MKSLKAIFVISAAALLLLIGCGRSSVQPSPTSAQVVFLPTERVTLFPPAGNKIEVTAEIAKSAKARTQGLMYRTELGPRAGMLFMFDREEVQRFWMKNTLISLDMIFINKELRVVGVVSEAVPQTLDSRFVDVPSQYVLEVRGGFAREHGIVAGTQVSFPETLKTTEGVDPQ